MNSIVIVGGGISGLSTAYYLSKLSKLNRSIGKVILIESSNRFGGWVQTLKNENNGALHEYGPRSLRKAGLAGENTLQLMNELGLGDQVLVKSSRKDSESASKLQRYVASNDELISLKIPPKTIFEAFFKQKPLNKALVKYLIHDWKTSKLDLSTVSLENLGEEKKIIERNEKILNEKLNDISIYEFIKLRLGEDLAYWLIDPLLRGISSGDARTLSIRSMFSDMFKMEREFDGIIRGMIAKSKASSKTNSVNAENTKENLDKNLQTIDDSSIWSFKNGMEQIPRSLVEFLSNDKNVELRTNSRLLNFKINDDKKLSLTIQADEKSYEIKADHVFFSINASDLVNLVPKEEKLETFKSTLETIRSASVATINLEFNRKDIVDKNPGFGFLTPSHVNSSILGVVFDSCVFPELNKSNDVTRLSVMCGGDWYNELCKSDGNLDESKMVEKSMKVLHKYLNLNEDPSFIKINNLKNCIPQYRVGHYLKLKVLDKEINEQDLRLSLIGSSYSGISLNDCIYNSKLKVENFLKS